MELLEYPFDNALILKKKRYIKRELLKRENLIEKKIAILSGSTIGEVRNILEIFLLNQGIKPVFFEGQYGRYYEEVIFENNELVNFKPDFIYIHTSNKNIDYLPSIDDDAEEINKKFKKVLNNYKSIWKSIKNVYKCTIIQNNFELPSYRIFGNKDVSDIHGITNFICRLNLEFSSYAQNTKDFFINDVHYLSSMCGLEKWSDASAWYLYKYCLNLECIPTLCNSITNIIKSILGRNKKSIILDLDNTLWDGIIGDVGVEGINIGNETSMGMIYSDFQKYLKEIRKLGITLNICSKNDINNAIEGLKHNRSILKVKDFICIKADWKEKYLNIVDIAKELNIMLDSIVFIDDNPVERDLVKSKLSNISVLNISKPESYINILDKSGFFEVTNLSEDDKKRNYFYEMNEERKKLQENFNDYSEYLRSLNMVCTIEKFKIEKIHRIIQLINKTNQFNLTTERYTETQVEDIINDNRYITICASLKDRFGDNGIVSLVIGRIENKVLYINLWVMSCRVFKRDLEFSVFDYLVKKCRELNIEEIRGYYYNSKRNSLVKEFYKLLGFRKIQEMDDGTIWMYVITNKYINMNKVMEVMYCE
ncbi:HAD-IIIC family phosphatase [Clostridium beijerinckii]|uniref:HAD-IIIC family phosphatase n=1 Tax=Clostridium beijerinckii TaxID=1520 RepID=UPI0015704E7E|nr:HAD-IIIC family phosphatase [Clostridium beijerinckii]NRT73692.1 FkbH-like protein [Clostridium beijerinckii]